MAMREDILYGLCGDYIPLFLTPPKKLDRNLVDRFLPLLFLSLSNHGYHSCYGYVAYWYKLGATSPTNNLQVSQSGGCSIGCLLNEP